MKNKISFFGLVVLLPLAFLLLACTCSNRKNNAQEKDTVISPLFAFDFTLNDFTPKERVTFLDSLGYNGITFNVRNQKDLKKLKEYQNSVELLGNEDFTIPAVFYPMNLGVKEPERTKLWKSLLKQLSLTQSDLWVIVQFGKKDTLERNEIVQNFQQMADFADTLNLDVIIYPHFRTGIETAAEALSYIKEVNRKNLFLSFHLCHELRVGNGERINEAIREVAPFIKLASISGSNRKMKENPPRGYWDDAIKSLYKGDYNTVPYLKALVDNGYTGPVALHTFGLNEPVQEHFSKSKEMWDKMWAEILLRR